VRCRVRDDLALLSAMFFVEAGICVRTGTSPSAADPTRTVSIL
jgi:hypothetical protein